MKRLLIYLFVIFISFFGGYVVRSSFVPLPPNTLEKGSTNLNEKVLWALVQSWRIDNGFTPYKENDLLCEIADIRVKEQLGGPDRHAGFQSAINKVLYDYPNAVDLSENTGYCVTAYCNEQRMLDSWLKSSSHSAALRKPYTHSCIRSTDRIAEQIFSSFQQ